MKFADGFWLNQKGYDVNYASQAYEIKTGKNFINVLATTNYIQNRGMTLGGPVLDITYSCTQKDVIKVSINHYMGTLDNAPKFELYEDQGFTPEIIAVNDLRSKSLIFIKFRDLLLRSLTAMIMLSSLQAIQRYIFQSSAGMFSSTTKTRSSPAALGELQLL